MKKTLLAVLAHPDDESYGIGGTLARYSAEGVEVHIAIATDGSAGSIDPKWDGDRSKLSKARAQELEAAAKILGAQVHMLGYRDSGYVGDPTNEHPEAFMNIDPEQVIGKVVDLIRTIRPQVMVTHDKTGGYFHPDHIHCCQIGTSAFHEAGDPEKLPGIESDPFQPQKLYYTAFSSRWIKYISMIMRLRGLDPTRMGRNQDIDFTKMGVPNDLITTKINYRKYWEIKQLASAEHGSQGGGTGFSRLVPVWVQKLLFGFESFILAYPQTSTKRHEKSLFENIH
jgi:LmbE family N-acetylglucosaminyl deacetylase